MELHTRFETARACGIDRIRRSLGRCHPFRHKSRISADKIDADFLRRLIEVLAISTKSSVDLQRCRRLTQWGNGNSLIHNRNSEFPSIASPVDTRSFCIGSDLYCKSSHSASPVAVNTVQEADAHRDGTYVQLLMGNHIVGLNYFKHINHVFIPSFLLPRYQMRCMLVKISSLWQRIVTPISSPTFSSSFAISSKDFRGSGNIHDHHHVKILLQNRLRDIQNVHPVFSQVIARSGNNAHPAFPTIVIIILLIAVPPRFSGLLFLVVQIYNVTIGDISSRFATVIGKSDAVYGESP